MCSRGRTDKCRRSQLPSWRCGCQGWRRPWLVRLCLCRNCLRLLTSWHAMRTADRIPMFVRSIGRPFALPWLRPSCVIWVFLCLLPIIAPLPSGARLHCLPASTIQLLGNVAPFCQPLSVWPIGPDFAVPDEKTCRGRPRWTVVA